MDYTIETLPPAVKEQLIGDRTVEINTRIRDDFELDDEEFDFVLEMLNDVFLKRVPVLEMPTRLSQMPHADQIDMRELGLRLAAEALWPLQDFLGDVDILINRLGGRVPALQHLSQPAQVKPAEEWIAGPARDVLRRYKQYNDLYLTQKPMANDRGKLQAPTVANWLDDYLRTMGASDTSSLKRSQYLVKSRNISVLNDAEKENLLNFLTSYDEGVDMYWRVAEGHYLVISREQPQEIGAEEHDPAKKMSELLQYYTTVQSNYRKLFEDKKRGLQVELGSQSKHLPDIVWDALGLGETERCLAALDAIIDRHGFIEMLQTDQRYKGILKRSIEVRFGVEAKNLWSGDISAVDLAIFWKLIMVEKLKVEDDRAAILADYFTKRLEKKISPAYLDLQAGRFRFRDIKYENRVLSFT